MNKKNKIIGTVVFDNIKNSNKNRKYVHKVIEDWIRSQSIDLNKAKANMNDYEAFFFRDSELGFISCELSLYVKNGKTLESFFEAGTINKVLEGSLELLRNEKQYLKSQTQFREKYFSNSKNMQKSA